MKKLLSMAALLLTAVVFMACKDNPVPDPVRVTGVTLNKTTLLMALVNGANETLVAAVAPAEATNKNVTWSSSDPTVAAVSEAGVVTAAKVGTATITVVSADDNTKQATCVVTVVNTVVAVESVTLDKATLSVKVSETAPLAATVAPADATNKEVTWTSSDPAVATVSSAGVVSGIKAGTATVTVASVADPTKKATCAVTVTATPAPVPVPVSGVALNKTALVIEVADTELLVATVSPSNATNKAVLWTTSNSNVATVSDAGLVTAIVSGTATITATSVADPTKTATCAVKVNVTADGGSTLPDMGNGGGL